MLPRLLGLGGIFIAAAEVLVAAAEKVQLQSMGDILIRQDEAIFQAAVQRALEKQIQREASERALRAEKRAQLLERAPATFDPTPEPQPLPQLLPQPQIVPFAEPLVTRPFPVFLPEPVAPRVAPPVVQPERPVLPRPEVRPVAIPIPSPLTIPLPSPLRVPLPTSDFPLTRVDVPTVPLTPSPVADPSFGFLADPQPLPQPQPRPVGAGECPPPRQCDDEVEEPRLECFKGLYKEGFTDTDFTPWTEIDCLTGREL